jgi:apolipoprotein D and lipocalin family protein
VLKVRFAPGFLSWLPQVWGDYQMIALAPDYSTVVVGSPDRKYLWILARTPRLDDQVYQRLLDEGRSQAFDVARILKVQQAAR